MEALSFTQKKLKSPRHVTGRELLNGVKELCLNKFGPMSLYVMEQWGICSTEDIGNIVFTLVQNNVLCKSNEDNLDNFRDAWDFHDVFHINYRKKLAKKISRMR